ncbi:hypothetical protein RHECNPAF_12210053 [Rhizobium etli CNPAF512]|nr:hypothetical protein RHECNPAF_12210053 [Rhizobium etli CNPAF512]
MTGCAAGFRNRACIACSLPPVGWPGKLIALKGFEPATPNSDLTFVRKQAAIDPGEKGQGARHAHRSNRSSIFLSCAFCSVNFLAN